MTSSPAPPPLDAGDAEVDIKADITNGCVASLYLLSLYNPTTKKVQSDQTPLTEALYEVVDNHKHFLPLDLRDKMKLCIDEGSHALGFFRNGLFVGLTNRYAPRYYERCLKAHMDTISITIRFPPNVISTASTAPTSGNSMFTTTSGGSTIITRNSTAGIKDIIDAKGFQKKEFTAMRSTSDKMGWYTDLVTHGSSCGIFIPPWDEVVRGDTMGTKWEAAKIGSKKHGERRTMKKKIYKLLRQDSYFPKDCST